MRGKDLNDTEFLKESGLLPPMRENRVRCSRVHQTMGPPPRMRENDTDGGNEDLDQGLLPRMRENLP